MVKRSVSSIISLAAAAALAGCVSGGGTPDDPEGTDGTGPQEEEEVFATAADVGPTGGVLALQDGFRMVIPAGALISEITIAVQRVDDGNSNPTYVVEPVGAKLEAPAVITLPTPSVQLPPNTVMAWQGYGSFGDSSEYEKLNKIAQSATTLTAEAGQLGYYTSGSPDPDVIASGEDYPRRIVADATHIYWASGGNLQRPVAYGNDGVIVRAPIGGGKIEVLTHPQPDPVGVAVNDTHVYWVNAGDGDLWQGSGTGGGVLRVSKSGGPAELLVDQGFPQAIALDATHVYWTEADADEVRKMPIDGGSVTVLAVGAGDPRHIALSDTEVFYTTGELGVVAKVSKSGGAPTVLSSEGGETTAITVHGGYVYWSNEGTGRIRRVAVSGGTPVTLREATQPTGLTAHGDSLYFVDLVESAVYAMPAAGGTATLLAADQPLPWAVHFHEGTNQLIWATAGKYDFEGGLTKLDIGSI